MVNLNQDKVSWNIFDGRQSRARGGTRQQDDDDLTLSWFLKIEREQEWE